MDSARKSVGEGGGGGESGGECNSVYLGIEKMIFPHSLCNLGSSAEFVGRFQDMKA